MTMAPNSPPPGWYPDGPNLRWWDGTRWTESAVPAAGPGYGAYQQQRPPQTEEEAGKSMSMIAHVGSFAGGFLVPLIVYAIEKDKNRFTRSHAAEALNFQITFLIVYFGGFALMFAGLFALIPSSTDDDPSAWFAVFPVVFFVLIFGLLAANIGFGIMGMVKASRGERWRYPVSIRFVDHGQ